VTEARRSTGLSPAQIDTLWRPQGDETVLWRGRPDALVLARTAFHARIVAVYFLVLAASAPLIGGGFTGALATIAGGVLALATLHGLAYAAARSTTYILTDRRLILRIGMAIEKTVNLPLRQIGAAHLSHSGGSYGEIALELQGRHSVGYLLLWPHARPWHLTRPQPMLRALPDAANVAEQLALAVVAHKAIARGDRPHGAPIARPAMAGAPA